MKSNYYNKKYGLMKNKQKEIIKIAMIILNINN